LFSSCNLRRLTRVAPQVLFGFPEVFQVPLPVLGHLQYY
jgi:hypothetical protein